MAADTDPTSAGRARARRMWHLLEPVHAVVYFAPGARDRFEAIGLRGFWMGYFAGRAAALGTPGPDLVEATFNVFHPAMVRRAVPDAWSLAAPGDVLAVRGRLAHDVLHDHLPAAADRAALRRAADLLVEVARDAPVGGRPLAAAHRALPVPDEPLDRLWWASTVLREHRGDGHVAALVAHDLDGAEALVLAAATGGTGDDLDLLRRSRQWPDDEWAAAHERLRSRGLVGDDGLTTTAGRAVKRAVEEATDRAAWRAYDRIDPASLDEADRAVLPLAQAVAAALIPRPNPICLDVAALR